MVYQGSKNRIAKDIMKTTASYLLMKYSPEEIQQKTYYEPFVGGANMIDKISKNFYKKRVGNDFNKYLIALLKHMQSDQEIEYKFIEKEDWYENYLYPFKRGELDLPEWEQGYLGFTKSFSGMWMGNSGVGYAAIDKTGRNKQIELHNNIKKQRGLPDWETNYKIFLDEALIEVKESKRENFKAIDFIQGDYKDMEIEDNSVVYLDPPYANTAKYKYEVDHNELYDWIKMLVNEKNCDVFISEYDMPEEFTCIWQKQINGGLAKGSAKAKPVEKLYVYEKSNK